MAGFTRRGALLSAVMLAALMAAIGGALQRFVPIWQPGYIIVACFVVALEASLLHDTFRIERMTPGEAARYLVPELMVMLVLMRASATLSVGARSLAEDARAWLYDPLSIFDPLFGVLILVGLMIGVMSHLTMRDLSGLAPQSWEGAEAPDEGGDRYGVLVAADRAAALGRINSRFVTGGVVLLCALAIEVVDVDRIGGPGHPVSTLSAGGALIYLVSGLLLYSQARLALLQSRWRREGARVAETVGVRWTRASWLIVLGVVVAALLLPRSYGMGLLDTLRAALAVLGYTLAVIGYLLLWLFSIIVLLPMWLMSLLGLQGGPMPPADLPIMPPPPPPPATHEPRLLAALVFWICMVMLAGYAGWIVVQRHPGLLRALTSRGPLAWVLARLGWVWRDTRGWARQAATVIQSVWRRPVALPARMIPSLRLRQMAPRELVRYFYLSTARRAAERGLPRRANQTPYEYGMTLAEQLPEVRDEVTELTEAFVVARYSSHPIGPEDARRARRPWERVRRQLRRITEKETL